MTKTTANKTATQKVVGLPNNEVSKSLLYMDSSFLGPVRSGKKGSGASVSAPDGDLVLGPLAEAQHQALLSAAGYLLSQGSETERSETRPGKVGRLVDHVKEPVGELSLASGRAARATWPRRRSSGP